MARPYRSLSPAAPWSLQRSDRQRLTLPNQRNAIFNRSTIGWNVRANFGFDLASNTAYGPLIGHFDINSDIGNGFDSPNGTSLCQHRLCDLGGHHGW